MFARAALIVATALAVVSGGFAHAQSTPAPAPVDRQAGLRTLAVDTRDQLLRNFSRLTCGAAPCAVATPEELANPPVTDAEAADIASVGMMSGLAQYCSVEWQANSFLPMMNRWRQTPNISSRKLALIAALHGSFQEQTLTAYQAEGPCTDQMRTALQAHFAQNGH